MLLSYHDNERVLIWPLFGLIGTARKPLIPFLL